MDAQARAESLSCWSTYPGVTIAPIGGFVEALGLGEGRTNTNFIATLPDGATRFFVRIGQDLPAYGVTRSKEQAAASAAAASGVGAAIIHAELPDAMVTAFVDGRALTEAQVQTATDGKDDKLLDAITGAIRKLHATPLPPQMLPSPEGGTPAAASWSPPDVRAWIECGRAGNFTRLPLLSDIDELLAKAEGFMAPLEPSSKFCHFDLLPDNFVVAPKEDGAYGVVIVDFEYANAGSPLMDLAVLSMGCGLTAEQEARLVASYLELPTPLDTGTAHRFQALKLMATLRETLWGVVAEVSGTSALTPEAAKEYTDSNYAKHLAARAEFEANCAARAE